MWLAEKAPTAKLTFGYHRYEIMGAVASVVLIWGITGVLIYEAIRRFIDPPESVDGAWWCFHDDLTPNSCTTSADYTVDAYVFAASLPLQRCTRQEGLCYASLFGPVCYVVLVLVESFVPLLL